MLDFLRQRSQTVVIKIILAGVILPFVLFYGYSKYNEDSTPSSVGSIANVNGEDIPASVYRMSYEQMMENYRRSLQGAQIPDFIQKMAQQNALQQLIQRQLMIQAAAKNRVLVSEKELADFIVKNFSREGEEFDPVSYRHGFLPSINQKLGINYEDYVRDDLRVNHLLSLFAELRLPLTLSSAPADSWEFEKVVLNEAQLKAKHKSSEPLQLDTVAQLFTAAKADWKRLGKDMGVEIKKVGPISLAERDLLVSNISLEDAAQAFQLQPSQSLALGKGSSDVTVIRFLGKKKTDTQNTAPENTEWAFLDSWMKQTFASAKIDSKLSE